MSTVRVIWGLCLTLGWLVTAEAAEGGKRVLVVHSFGSAEATAQSVAFETELTRRMGNEKVHVDEVYLDHARYPETELEEALVDYLEKRVAKWQPDMVVPLVSPACLFVAQHRERLFPSTPILYAGMDKRRLPAGALAKNAAFVGNSLDLPGFAEDILQLAPDTTNIVCVIGDSPAERYWKAEFQREFARFTNRVGFTWLNDLPFDQMLERVKRLPPRSFVLLILLLRDAAGVAHVSDDALKQISEAANAPVNGLFDYQLGTGIVGGRLYSSKAEAVEAGRIAVQILQGQPASTLSPVIVGPSGPQYDWRELRRWSISEERLPPGSVVKFRQPSLWERYRGFAIAGVWLLVAQGALIAGLVMNLRQRRTAERLLRESEERMKMAATAGELGMWEWDFASRKIWVEGRGRERIGEGKNGESDYDRFMRTIHPEDRESVSHALAKAIAGGGSYEHVHRRILPDGQVRWIAARARVEFDAGHRPLKMRGVGIDITAQKVAEDRARESQREFLLIANSAPVLIWTAGLDKGGTFFNQSWLNFTGRTMEQELGEGWTNGVHPDDLESCMKVYTESFDAQQPFTVEYRLRRHDGQYRWLLDHGAPRYDAESKFLGYIGSCVDVTEAREAEQEAQRLQQELAHVSRVSVVSELAGSLAHELNQPLTAIVASAAAAKEFMKEERRNDEELCDALKDILEEGHRAGEIIARIRGMLRKDLGQMAREDMNIAVKEVLEMVHSDLVIRRVTPVLRLDPLLPPVNGHGVQLRQVLLNLVINACDAMSDAPASQRRLTIESRRVTDHEVEISVGDSGPGFPAEMLRHAFEPFHTTKAKGLGLGLAICRSIVRAHGGRLVATNNPDKGAILRFTLPAKNGAHESIAAPSERMEEVQSR